MKKEFHLKIFIKKNGSNQQKEIESQRKFLGFNKKEAFALAKNSFFEFGKRDFNPYQDEINPIAKAMSRGQLLCYYDNYHYEAKVFSKIIIN